MSYADVVLGKEWLPILGSKLKRIYDHNSLSFVSNGVHVLLLGENNIPPTPLIFNNKLSYLNKANLIEGIFFCYCMSLELTSHEQNTMSIEEQSSINSFNVEKSVLDDDSLSFAAKANLDNLLTEFKDIFPAHVLL